MGFAANRPILVPAIIFLALSGGLTQLGLGAADPPTLVRQDAPATQRARVILEVSGTMRNVGEQPQAEAREQADEELPVSVRADFLYSEHILESAEVSRAVRWYDRAEVTIHTGERQQQPELPEDRRAILFERNGTSPALFTSLQGPLTRTQQELLVIPGASPLIHRVLPAEPVGVDGTWKPHDDAISQLLNMQAISEQSVQGKLISVEDGTAVVDLRGSIKGMAENVLSRVQLKGKLNVNLATGQVTWAALLIEETRDGSATRPEFNITAKLRLRTEPVDLAGQLKQFAELAQDSARHVQPIQFLAAHGDLELQHDPNWRVTSDRHDRTTLQLVRSGNLIAHCNMSPLPDLPIGKTITLDEFRADVKNAVRQHNGQIVDATTAADDRRNLLRVVAIGEVNSTTVQWTYCHVVAPNGRRAVLAFTMNPQDADRFDSADLELIQGLRFPEPSKQANLPGTLGR